MQQDFSLIQVCFQVMINKADSSPAQQTGTAQQIKKLHLLHSPIYQSAFFFCDRKCLNVAFVRKKIKLTKYSNGMQKTDYPGQQMIIINADIYSVVTYELFHLYSIYN